MLSLHDEIQGEKQQSLTMDIPLCQGKTASQGGCGGGTMVVVVEKFTAADA